MREHALEIWRSAVEAVRPGPALERLWADPTHPLRLAVERAERIWVVGAGKAGTAMAQAVETLLADRLDRIEGIVNVPAGSVQPLQRIRLHAARPDGSNHPTPQGVVGAEQMLQLFAQAGPDDVGLCLLSGGGSALLPAPAEGISLADKQAITQMLHACGATIHEMNTVRKHLSRIKGGGLARYFRGWQLHSLVISDVIGDPLDVIASGPTTADPSTFADAIAILRRYQLWDQVPASVRRRLEQGQAGQIAETLKVVPANVFHHLLGNNRLALAAAQRTAEQLGYRVLNLGTYIEGETREVARVVVGMVRSIRAEGQPLAAPACLLLGGETTVTLGPSVGKGGRNQEFVLSALHELRPEELAGVTLLSGGTDGEDGPTDAAGAVVDAATAAAIRQRGWSIAQALQRHDAYPLLDDVAALIRTGWTGTNVMDVRLVLIAGS